VKPSEYIHVGWCQGVVARNNIGRKCTASDPDAIQWCAAGAISASLQKPVNVCQAMDELRDHLGDYEVTTWNDEGCRTKQEVIAALEAIGL
jgi:hypothetical protein